MLLLILPMFLRFLTIKCINDGAIKAIKHIIIKQ
jgi:hypothetical protein